MAGRRAYGGAGAPEPGRRRGAARGVHGEDPEGGSLGVGDGLPACRVRATAYLEAMLDRAPDGEGTRHTHWAVAGLVPAGKRADVSPAQVHGLAGEAEGVSDLLPGAAIASGPQGVVVGLVVEPVAESGDVS